MQTKITKLNKNKKYEGAFWPSEDDALLLKAILLPREEAIKAWEKWLEYVNIDTLEAGTQRMFPLLYVKLKKYNITHPLMEKFKGIYRQTWYKNQMMIHRTTPILQHLQEEGIDTLILKGAALTSLYYKDLGLRHMSDLDIMVTRTNAKKAMSILMNADYEPLGRTWESFYEEMMYIRHSIGFRHKETKQEIDLHWHLTAENCALHDDDLLWQNKQPVTFNNMEVFTLDATDHLMHTCIHGSKINGLTSIRWIVDAATVIDQDTIDWEKLVSEAQRRKIVLIMLEALSYLQEVFFISIPDTVLSKLANSKIDRIEKYANIANKMPLDKVKTFFGYFFRFKYWCMRYAISRYNTVYACLNPKMSLNFIKVHWKLSSMWDIPKSAVKWVIETIRQ